MEEVEKKAIKYLQHLREYVAGTDEEEFVLLALNLIEKQNNRIEQLEKTLDENTTEHIATVNRLQELEKELEPIHKMGIPVEVLVSEFDRLENLEDDTDCLKYRIKELEKENEEYKEYIKRLDKLNSKDFIFKSEIIEKIEELENQTNTANDEYIRNTYSPTGYARACCVGILNELLENNNENS